MQDARVEQVVDLPRGEAELDQLLPGHDSVLAAGHGRNAPAELPSGGPLGISIAARSTFATWVVVNVDFAWHAASLTGEGAHVVR